ncbi:hypothetical protein [Algoriphagus taiwanensis]|uniref:Uncharacterized protein n=1 Tax=Algoriphagus taiwanensis TaxID=1445656 RepID=A0ABQ6Q639_9BACT|nr:hypothetical protein Ataiwa_38110 [Algoriphagus taiwanensis]
MATERFDPYRVMSLPHGLWLVLYHRCSGPDKYREQSRTLVYGFVIPLLVILLLQKQDFLLKAFYPLRWH